MREHAVWNRPHAFIPPTCVHGAPTTGQALCSHMFCAGQRASTQRSACPQGAYSLGGDQDMTHTIPQGDVRKQLRVTELVRKATESLLEEGRLGESCW